MLRFFYIIALVLMLSMPAMAAKYAGEAFALGVGGRALAMGGAATAGPFDATAIYWNPAGMTRLDGRRVVAMHAETFGSLLNHDFVAYVDAHGKENSLIKAFGFYFYYLGGGGIKITALNEFDRPYVVREESHGDFLFAAAVAGQLARNIDFGLTAKVIYRDIGTESGKGLTMDAGVLYRAAQWIRAGLMVTDVTTGFIRYSGETFDDGANTESIYPTVRPGLAMEKTYRDFVGRFAVTGDIKFEGIKDAAQYWSGSISLDTHYGWEVSYKDMLFGRAGFDIGNFTVGGGVDIRNVTVDFAFLQHDALDETYRVSAGYRF